MPPALDELCDDVLKRHHAFAHGSVPMIRGWLATLAERQPVDSPHLVEVRDAFGEFGDLLLGHMAKEENILFPALVALAEAARARRGRPALPFPTVLHPIRMMETEHARLELCMARIRALTDGFMVADGSSDAWRQIVDELARLDDSLRAHLRIENETLFPLALDVESRL